MGESPDSLGSLKKVVADCFAVRPSIYWADLLATALVGWGAFFATELWLTRLLPAAAFAFVVSAFAFYRGMLFIHELVHRARGELPGYSLAWNLLFGVPWLLPSFTFRGVHCEHHNTTTYGTRHDFEYLDFGGSPIAATVRFALKSFVMPVAMVVRFGLLAPLSLVVPRLRRYVMLHTSALSMRLDVPRTLPSGTDLRNWYAQEFLCCAWVLGLAVWLPLNVVLHGYALMTAVFLLNSVRTPISHRYANVSARELTFKEQVLDSVNIDGGFVAELFCPLGFRYHGLHHLLPAIPYHQLGAAHRRLRAQLPRDSPYHATVERSVAAALSALLRGTSRESSDRA